ncbi:hypothetical protein ACS0TY_003435 [Phlomoides rotata]
MANDSGFSNLISNSSKHSLAFSVSTILPKIGGLSIKCARVGGDEIPTNKMNKLIKKSEKKLTTLREDVSKYTTKGNLRRFNVLAIRRLKGIQCY